MNNNNMTSGQLDAADSAIQGGMIFSIGIWFANAIGWLDAHSGAVVALCSMMALIMSGVGFYWRCRDRQKNPGKYIDIPSER